MKKILSDGKIVYELGNNKIMVASANDQNFIGYYAVLGIANKNFKSNQGSLSENFEEMILDLKSQGVIGIFFVFNKTIKNASANMISIITHYMTKYGVEKEEGTNEDHYILKFN